MGYNTHTLAKRPMFWMLLEQEMMEVAWCHPELIEKVQTYVELFQGTGSSLVVATLSDATSDSCGCQLDLNPGLP